jgi:hypothetical protein
MQQIIGQYRRIRLFHWSPPASEPIGARTIARRAAEASESPSLFHLHLPRLPLGPCPRTCPWNNTKDLRR